MRTLEQHQEAVAALLQPTLTQVAAEIIELDVIDPKLLGRLVAAPVVARLPIPAFDNSQMDGFAVRAADVATAGGTDPVTLPLGHTIAAGDTPGEHQPGTAAPIMTGAAIPAGADAIIPIEHATPPRFTTLVRPGQGTPSGEVAFSAPVEAGKFIRRQAEDVSVGDVVVTAGVRMTPARIGAAAAAGVSQIPVHRGITVLLCSTGDELSGHTGLPAPGHIADANTPMLQAALTQLGAEVTTLRLRDTPELLREALGAQAAKVDLIITTGGISMGAFEVVRQAFHDHGVQFGKVAIQPGGPQGLGLITATDDPTRHVPIICFPGNPVSALLSFELFVAPHLRTLQGVPAERPRQQLPLAHPVSSPVDKHQVRRGHITSTGQVEVSRPGSHLIGELADAQLLVHLPIGFDHGKAGTLVETWRFND